MWLAGQRSRRLDGIQQEDTQELWHWTRVDRFDEVQCRVCGENARVWRTALRTSPGLIAGAAVPAQRDNLIFV